MAERKPAERGKQTAKGTTARGKESQGFTAEERAAMKERARELKAEARASKNKADGERDVLAAIAAMKESDRAMAERLHAIITRRRACPLAEDVVRNARICQGRQGRLMLQERGEVQVEVRDVQASKKQRISTKAQCGRPPSR